MSDILSVEVMLSNFEGRDKVSVVEFLEVASMLFEETIAAKARAETVEVCAKEVAGLEVLWPNMTVKDAEQRMVGASTMQDWQPIETAPKDGTPVLLAMDLGGVVCGRVWDRDYGKFSGHPIDYNIPDGHVIGWMCLPTHIAMLDAVEGE